MFLCNFVKSNIHKNWNKCVEYIPTLKTEVYFNWKEKSLSLVSTFDCLTRMYTTRVLIQCSVISTWKTLLPLTSHGIKPRGSFPARDILILSHARSMLMAAVKPDIPPLTCCSLTPHDGDKRLRYSSSRFRGLLDEELARTPTALWYFYAVRRGPPSDPLATLVMTLLCESTRRERSE